MPTREYISPQITLLYCSVEQGFGASQASSDINVDIGDWDEEYNDYNIN